MIKPLRIVTRQSPLALRQASIVKTELQILYPSLNVTILGITTEGDTLQDLPLHKLGGKGLFVKTLEEKLLNDEADIAVHSMKDIPSTLPEGLEIGAILEREDPRDVLISSKYPNIFVLPQHAIIGTSSLRRQSQIASLRSDLSLIPLRGNIETRIDKLDKGEFDAIILAAAGIHRLGFSDRIGQYLSFEQMLPAVGQGALGIECRIDDTPTKHFIAPLHHSPSALCIQAERRMNEVLGGSCQLPIAALGIIDTHFKQLTLLGMVGDPLGQTILKTISTGDPKSAAAIGEKAAKLLLEQGAQRIIDESVNYTT